MLDMIILVVGFCFLAIAIHQSIYLGFANSYWMFMLSAGLLLWYTRRKGQAKRVNNSENIETRRKEKM